MTQDKVSSKGPQCENEISSQTWGVSFYTNIQMKGICRNSTLEDYIPFNEGIEAEWYSDNQ